MEDGIDAKAGAVKAADGPADLSRSDVQTKYRAAAEVANKALKEAVAACVDGAKIYDICRLADQLIEDSVTPIYNKKNATGEKPKKGVAFPTSVSVNEVCGHFSPLKEESPVLKAGDLCKIDVGCHIDGFVALAAHSVVVPTAPGAAPESEEITGRKADVILAAWTALEAAVRTVREGNTSHQVTKVMNEAIEEFNCRALVGVQSHQMTQHVIDGSQVILLRETSEDRNETFKFARNEVYAIDVVASTGDGKPKEADIRSTIYKRDIDQTYKLKTQLARKFIGEVNSKYPTMPFTITAFEDERMARLGISEGMRHDLLIKYPVVAEKPGDLVARFKCTVLLLPGGTKKVTGLAFPSANIKSELSVKSEDLKKLLAEPLEGKAKKEAPKEVVG